MAYSGVGMYVGTDASGGYQVDTVLTQKAFLTPQPLSVMREFLNMRVKLGLNQGDTVHRNKWGDISTAGAEVAESATIATDRKFILSQSTATVSEFGNSVSAKSKLVDLANINVNDPILKGLRNDERKTIDAYLYTNIYNAAMKRYVGTATNGGAVTSDATATATCASVLNSYHIRSIVYELEGMNVPKLPGDVYACIGSLKAIDNIRDDADWKNVQIHKELYNGLTTNYVGTLHGVAFFGENSAMSGSGIKTFSNYSSSGKAFFIGDDYGTEDAVLDAEVRTNAAIAHMMGRSSDFGRLVDIGWYEMAAFGTLWNDATQCHCVAWDSA